MKLKLLQTTLALSVFVGGGCARFILPTPAQFKAIAADTNSLDIKLVSVYGTLVMRRNMATSPLQVKPTE